MNAPAKAVKKPKPQLTIVNKQVGKIVFRDISISCFLIFASILAGSLIGINTGLDETLGQYVDYIILTLVFLVLADAPLNKITEGLKEPSLLAVTWITNFLLIPIIGFGLTQLFMPEQPLLAIGLAIYFMSPCTDWFLGFTRMAKGNTAMGSVLLPINMITQFILYPVYLQWYSESTTLSITASDIFNTFSQWFLMPFALALVLKLIISKPSKLLSESFKIQTAYFLSASINWVMYALIITIFAANIQQILDYKNVLMIMLITIISFFILINIITESIAKKLNFQRADHVLYSITTTARNAPLMLGLTMTALPDQPIVYIAIIIGMLVEFPILALQVYRFNKGKAMIVNSSLTSVSS